MNFPKLPRSLVLSAIAVSLAVVSLAEGTAETALRDHVDAAVPAYLTIEQLHVRLLGSPVTKAKAELTMRAAETLYVEAMKAPELRPIAAELTADLRLREPKALRVLRVVTPEGKVTQPLNFDFGVTAGETGLGLGRIDIRKFASFGLPRSEFPSDSVPEDTLEGKAAISAWQKVVADYNQALKVHEGRTRADRNTGMLFKGLDEATKVIRSVRGGADGVYDPATKALGLTGSSTSGVAPETKTGAPETASQVKPASKDLVELGNKAGRLFNGLLSR